MSNKNVLGMDCIVFKCVKVIVQMINDMLDWLYQCDLYFYQISSASNCTDYQSRRLNIKYREKNKEDGVHVETVSCLFPHDQWWSCNDFAFSSMIHCLYCRIYTVQ